MLVLVYRMNHLKEKSHLTCTIFRTDILTSVMFLRVEISDYFTHCFVDIQVLRLQDNARVSTHVVTQSSDF